MDEVLKEEWELEIDTLKSIFLDQFKHLTPPTRFEITILPNPDAEDESENNVGIIFQVALTPNYPDEPPSFNIRPLKGVTSQQCKELSVKLLSQAEEFVGMEMIYPLTQILKEWVDEENMDTLDKQKEKAKVEEELEIQRERDEYSRKYISEGTVVTKESFEKWFNEFLIRNPHKDYLKPEVKTTTKLTGREFFEKCQLLGMKMDDVENEEENVDWELFSKESELLDDEEQIE